MNLCYLLLFEGLYIRQCMQFWYMFYAHSMSLFLHKRGGYVQGTIKSHLRDDEKKGTIPIVQSLSDHQITE